ncbi:MAG: glycine--tRNA ligase [Patescibacteria group bacterium]|nr:glycine--tRNA ligase [Patescibacteria group bacterium]
MKTLQNLDQLVNLAKARGFVYQGSEIYGGLANTWDYGPLGIELKNNIRDTWWQQFVQRRYNMYGLDAAILMNPKVWEASGHVGGFSDPLIDCKECNTRHRADKLIEDYWETKGIDDVADGWSNEKTRDYMIDEKIVCPDCGACNWTDVRRFNLMFTTKQGVTADAGADIYLRPETAQGIFVDFKRIMQSMRPKLPFGVCQTGKAFRNEITPGNFIFRTREFEQMEIEYFVKPGEHVEAHKEWEDDLTHFYKNVLSVNHEENFRLRWHNDDELSHYSSGTFDIEYKFPFGWSELWGCASRTDFDLKQHMEHSGQDMTYFDAETNQRYVPYVIEPSFGLSRTLLMVLCDAYHQEEVSEGDTRTVMKFAPVLAPYKAAILPLTKKLSSEAQDLYAQLSKHFAITFDESGSIGKRYRKQDEIGTPLCITVDFDTTGTGNDNDPALKDTVTVRDRDTMEQVRMPISELRNYIESKIEF